MDGARSEAQRQDTVPTTRSGYVVARARDVATNWFALQVVIALSAYFAYFLVRGFTEGGVARATDNANLIVDLEKALGMYWEPAWQDLIDGSGFLTRAANSIYIYGHWPVIACVAVWLAHRHRGRYLITRNAFLISGGMGLIVFVLFPAAPPRLVPELAILDTVTLHTNAYRVLQPPALTNQYAAMPSLHLGWNVLISLAVWVETRSIWVRVPAFALPVAMTFAVVATGNHYILDAIIGVAVALAGLWVASYLRHGTWRIKYGS